MASHPPLAIQEAFKALDIVQARVAELEADRDRFERRRGGECTKCGSWVCPPLTCMSCLADAPQESRDINASLTARVEELETENAELRKERDNAVAVARIHGREVDEEMGWRRSAQAELAVLKRQEPAIFEAGWTRANYYRDTIPHHPSNCREAYEDWCSVGRPGVTLTESTDANDVSKEGEKTYPCDKCGKLRTKAEGGTTFTVCDGCWDEHWGSKGNR